MGRVCHQTQTPSLLACELIVKAISLTLFYLSSSHCQVYLKSTSSEEV